MGVPGPGPSKHYAARGNLRVPYQFTAIANQTRLAFVSMAYNTKSDGTLCGLILDDVSLVCTRSHRDGCCCDTTRTDVIHISLVDVKDFARA
jgi:hypothetical protein